VIEVRGGEGRWNKKQMILRMTKISRCLSSGEVEIGAGGQVIGDTWFIHLTDFEGIEWSRW
jgi:hypothetical protein